MNLFANDSHCGINIENFAEFVKSNFGKNIACSPILYLTAMHSQEHSNASKAYWLSFAVSRYARSKSLTPDFAFQKLREFGVMDFLDKHYETEHLENIICDRRYGQYFKTKRRQLGMIFAAKQGEAL